MKRRTSEILRSIVLASLPALAASAATVGCSSGGSGDTADGGGDTTNCGMCGCDFDGTHTQTVPYRISCDSGVVDTGDASDADDAPADAFDAIGADACAPPETWRLDCSYQCPSGVSAEFAYPSSCKLAPSAAGAPLMVECTYIQPCGRRPALLARATEARARDAIGRHLAGAAFLEAASIDAFAILARELAAHGAPSSLVRRARRAARDEVRHARAMRGLSARFGATPARPRTSAPRVRALEAIAVENAIEGCVRETYGAAMAAWQAETAQDPAVRRAMQRIALDEAKHADLAWSVARWASRRLDRSARDRIDDARTKAVTDLRRDLETEPDPRVVERLGVPDRAAARVLVDHLHDDLWQRAS